MLSISRPSGERAHPAMVAPLLGPPTGGTDRDAVAALFIADTDDSDVSMSQVFQGLYSLTHAEAELVELLVQGLSLEEAAQRRGVTMNTVRSQLKEVFSKTGTKRQGQLVRLVLSSVAPIQDEQAGVLLKGAPGTSRHSRSTDPLLLRSGPAIQ